MSNTLRNTLRTIRRLHIAANKQIQSNPTQARIIAEKAYAIATGYPFSTPALTTAQARTLRLLADCHRIENQLDMALSYASQAARLFQESHEIDEYIMAMDLLSTLHWHRGSYERALELLQECLQWEHKIQSRKLLGEIRGSIGKLLSSLGNHKQALLSFQQALLIAEGCRHYKLVYRTLTNIAITHGSMGELLLAVEYFLRALASVKKYAPDKERSMGFIFMNLGNTLRTMGSYEQALQYLLQALSLLEEHGTPIEVGVVFNTLGILYHDRQEYEPAKAYLQRALATHNEKDGAQNIRANGKSTLAFAELQLGNIDTALHHAFEALHISESIGNPTERIYALGVIAAVYKHQKEYGIAKAYYQQRLDACNTTEALWAQIATHTKISQILICQQHYEEALEHLHQARTLAEPTQEKPQLVAIYKTLVQLHEETGNMKQAFECLKLLYELDKQLFNEKAEQNIQVLNILHRVEQAEKEMTLYRESNEELQLNIERVQKELAAHALQIAQQTDLLQKTKCELAALASHHVIAIRKELNTSINTIEQVLPRSKATKSIPSAKGLQHTIEKLAALEKDDMGTLQEKLVSLFGKIDEALLDQGMWHTFEQQFRQLHSGFTETLSQRYPQLSTVEMKVCTLIKINLSSKEIGRILNVSSRSVDTYRYNIRQKLGLSSKDNLTQFIAELSQHSKQGEEPPVETR